MFPAFHPCYLRKSFGGLQALLIGQLQKSVNSGALSVFTNRRRNRLKNLLWDRTGLWVCTSPRRDFRYCEHSGRSPRQAAVATLQAVNASPPEAGAPGRTGRSWLPPGPCRAASTPDIAG